MGAGDAVTADDLVVAPGAVRRGRTTSTPTSASTTSCRPTSSCATASGPASCWRAARSGRRPRATPCSCRSPSTAALVPPSVRSGSVVDVYLTGSADGSGGQRPSGDRSEAVLAGGHRDRRPAARRVLRGQRQAAAGAGRHRRGRRPVLRAGRTARRPGAHRRPEGLTWSSSWWSPPGPRGSRRRSPCSASGPAIVVLKRCVDVDDLLAAASAGQAHVAVVGVDAPGLDQAAVEHLRAYAVRPVAIVPGGAALDAAALRATRIGIRSIVAEDELESLPDAVAAGEEPADTVVRPAEPGEEAAGSRRWPGGWSRSGARPARRPHHRRHRPGRRAGPARAAHGARRRRPLRRRRRPAARHPRRGLGPAVGGPGDGRRDARGAVRLGAALGRTRTSPS